MSQQQGQQVYAVPETPETLHLQKQQGQFQTELIPTADHSEHEFEPPAISSSTDPAPNFQANAQTTKPESHPYLYAGAAVTLIVLYAIYIFLCKWRKDNKNKKKPIKNQLIEEKVEETTTPASNKMNQEVEMVQLP